MNPNLQNTTSPRMNPMVPESVGALIAEESTIGPTSILPSFLERMMMEECRKSGWQTLQFAANTLTERLGNIERQLESYQDNLDTARDATMMRWTSSIRRTLQKLSLYIVRVVRNRLLLPLGPEVRFLLVYWLEHKSLITLSSTITGALYGCKRTKLVYMPRNSRHTDKHSRSRLKRHPQEEHNRRLLRPISKRDCMRLAFFMALGPYLEERSNSIQTLLSIRIPNLLRFSDKQRRKMRSILGGVWPLLRVTTKATFLCYQWRYLMGRSAFFDPYSSSLNVIERRVTLQDQQQNKKTQEVARDFNEVNSKADYKKTRIDSVFNHSSAALQKNLLQGKSTRTNQVSMGVISLAIALSIMARVQSLQQELRREEEERQAQQLLQPAESRQSLRSNHFFPGSSNKKRIPPPPHPAAPNFSSDKLSLSSMSMRNVSPKVCPICQEPHVHPTASTSGYVFCFKCIYDFLAKEGVCPRSGKLCRPSDLIRLYEPHRT